jgi:putative MATE family efflux protein
MSATSSKLGTERIGKLLAAQSIPAAIGFMVMSLNMVVDTIFVGKYIGKLGIGAISIVMPISFLMSSVGMAIGIGGSSIVSRAFGAKDNEKAQLTFNNQVSLTLLSITVLFLLGLVLQQPLLALFGAKGELMQPTATYYFITLLGIPFLSLAMMANNNLRAEGKPRIAMTVLLIPSLINIILDYIFIVRLDMGMTGAGWATTLAYVATGSFMIYYYTSGKTELRIDVKKFKLQPSLVKEIVALGSVSIFRQGSISLLTIILNQSLFHYGQLNGIGGETAISIYAIPNRIAMFAFFPLIGIAQGFVPIAGYNYGARHYDRVREAVKLSIILGLLIAILLSALLLMGANVIPGIFTSKEETDILIHAPKAIFLIFMASPVVIFQLIGSSYFQAIGKATPALLLTLSKQLFFLTPLVLILPLFYGFEGIWYAFPLADLLSASVCILYLRLGMKRLAKSVN